MASSMMNIPKFWRGQSVCFTGGKGIIQSYKSDAGNWTYQIEMAMGPEPSFGRMGHETVVVLSEAELEPSENQWSDYLAIA